jgi:hypothetical protein
MSLAHPIGLVLHTQDEQIVTPKAGDHPHGHAEALLELRQMGVQQLLK